jgi:hypothetical protein
VDVVVLMVVAIRLDVELVSVEDAVLLVSTSTV